MPKNFPDRSAIVSEQLLQLRELLEELGANPFYRKKFAGLDHHVADLEDFSGRFPFTTKQDLSEDQQAHPPFGTNLTYPLDRYRRCHQTSGTAGRPLRWLDTSKSWQRMTDNWREIFEAAGVTAKDRIYFAFSFGPFIGFWLAFEAASQIGALCLPGGGLSSAARLRSIFENEATVLCSTPTYALRLAEVALTEKIELKESSIKKILVAGEPGGSIPSTRALLQSLWGGARVYDHHGMTETGPVTLECPVQPGVLHVLESSFYAEVLNEKNELVAPEVTGELVLTTLDRLGSPVVRYRTGDLVKPLAFKKCECGRAEVGLLGGILGRADDMVIVRGVNIYPSAVEDVLRRHKNVGEYQVDLVKEGPLLEMKIRIEALEKDKRLTAEVEKDLQQTFNLRIPVEGVKSGSLPRAEMKSRRWNRV